MSEGGTPAAPTTIAAAVVSAAARFARREALVDGDTRLDFAELATEARRVAGALVASGIEPGERIAIWAPNIAEWVLAALGAYHCGAVVVTMNTRFKGGEAGHILRTSGARLAFTVAGFLDTNFLSLLADAGPLPALTEVVLLRGSAPGATDWEEFLRRAESVDDGVVSARLAALGADDVSDILFTSGTTGPPKGAMLTHGASVRAYRSWADVVGLTAGDRYLIVNPFFHAFGLKAGILACLLKGATMLPQAVFDVPAVLRRVREERISALPGPPAIYQTMLEGGAGSGEPSTLRLAVTGGAVVPVELIRRMRTELGFTSVVTGYGLTESTGIATMCRSTDDPETIATTAGRPIDGVEVRIVDADGASLPAGAPGEVLIRGYVVMAGYIGDPAATAEVVDEEGWLHTGDVGTLDGAGNLALTGRLKDMFIVGGFNAYPAEIESILSGHPGIAAVAVVGVPDERLGEVGAAYVVARRGADLDAGSLAPWCRQRMANYKVPRHFHLVEDLPRNASGKVLKFELRKTALGTD